MHPYSATVVVPPWKRCTTIAYFFSIQLNTVPVQHYRMLCTSLYSNPSISGIPQLMQSLLYFPKEIGKNSRIPHLSLSAMGIHENGAILYKSTDVLGGKLGAKSAQNLSLLHKL